MTSKERHINIDVMSSGRRIDVDTILTAYGQTDGQMDGRTAKMMLDISLSLLPVTA